jgi:hypothetical protein
VSKDEMRDYVGQRVLDLKLAHGHKNWPELMDVVMELIATIEYKLQEQANEK